jgi:hypothetical protein
MTHLNNPPMIFNQWLTEKPDFDQECIVITDDVLHGVSEYGLHHVMWMPNDGYWAILDGAGNEDMDIADLKADRYFIIQTK